MESLRTEILQAQTARSDLLKWKIGLVGVVGSVGLGLAGSHAPGHPELVLCAIPLVCAYVDLLCRHLSLRMIVIGTAVRKEPSWGAAGMLSRYEDFVNGLRSEARGEDTDPFALEDWALTWSTVGLSGAVAIYGIVFFVTELLFNQELIGLLGLLYIAAGVAGGLVTDLARRKFNTRAEALADMDGAPSVASPLPAGRTPV